MARSRLRENYNRKYINGPDDFPVTPSGGIIDLTSITEPTSFSVNSDLILTDQIKMNSTVIFEEGLGRIVYVGGGTLFVYDDIDDSNFVLRDITIVDGIGGTATLLDIDSVTPGSGIVIIQTVGIVGFLNVGTVNNTIITIDTASVIQCGYGFIISNAPFFTIGNYLWSLGLNLSGSSVITLEGDMGNGSINNCTATLNTNEFFFDIDSTSTIASGTVYGCTANLALGGQVFASGSKDQTDIYWKYQANSNIPPSQTTYETGFSSNTSETDIPAVDVPVRVNATFVEKSSERFQVYSNGEIKYIGLEEIKLPVFADATQRVVTGVNVELSLQIGHILADTYEVTFDNTTNKVLRTAHGQSNDDRMRLATSDALPTGLRDDIPYYVINANANDFQLSLTIGGTAITFTNNGTGTHYYQLGDVEGTEIPSVASSVNVGNFGAKTTLTLNTNDIIWCCVSNKDTTSNIVAENLLSVA